MTLIAVLVFSASAQTRTKAPAVNPDMLWATRVEPILDKYCLKCHAGVRQQGNLDLRSLETALRGGDSGSAILPGNPNASRIVQYVVPKSPVHMPPDPKKQLTADEIAALKAWIAAMPVPKVLPSGAPKDATWAAQYMAQYRKSLQTYPPPPAKLSASAAIDWFLQTDWKRDKVEPSGLCDDSAFARRLYLDLAGRIPTYDELNRFVADKQSDKRQKLIAKLLASEDYPRYWREIFDTVLMGRPSDRHSRQRIDSGWNAFLEDGFRANRPWNEIVYDMLTARPAEGAKRGAVWFLAERQNSHQAIAEAVAPVVFGMQIKCAQCHNHPLAWEIEQKHYWGLVAAFNRSKNVETETGLGVGESAVGGFINFANLKKESQPALMVFLNGKSVDEKIPDPNAKEMDTADLYLVPPVKEGQKPHSPAIPKFSRREAFAASVTRDNPLLARAFVNRVWAALMGRGFVQPVDQIDSWHHTAHPELFEWLSRDFERSGYDIKSLIRNIVSSAAYERDTKPNGKIPPLPETFARALEKPLTAEQIFRSLQIATGNSIEPKAAQEKEQAFVQAFPDVMPDTYSPSLQQALFLSNSPLVDELLKPTPNSTLAKLLQIKTNVGKIQTAFRTVLGRAPDAIELKQCETLLMAQLPEKGCRNLLWALLTCAEFQVNH